jgi:3-dehydroquinate synthase
MAPSRPSPAMRRDQSLGHAIEAVAGYGTLLHGEAVALGMVAAAQVSAERSGLPKQEMEELVDLIRQFDLPIKLPESLSRSQILEKVFADKKFVNRKIRFVVTPKLGSAFLAENITVEDLESGLTAIDPSQK